jgi:hypothetical protein
MRVDLVEGGVGGYWLARARGQQSEGNDDEN